MIIEHLAIVGSRDAGFTYDHLDYALSEVLLSINPILIVSGGTKGVDALAEEWSNKVLKKKAKVFKADWTRYKKGAGHIRNEKLVRFIATQEFHHLAAFWDGKSRGTANALEWCITYSVPYTVFTREYFNQL